MLQPVLIELEALYDDGALQQALGLTASALASARRAGTLRYIRKGKRTLYKGNWILSWLEAEAEPRQVTDTPRNKAVGREVGHEG